MSESSNTPVPPESDASAPREAPLDRRTLLIGAGVTVAGAIGIAAARRWWHKTAPVFLACNQRYDGPLARTIRDGFLAVGFDPEWVRGRRVLLKPNLVEPNRDAPHRTTHPSVVAAAIEVFLGWGAEVAIGEAPAHVRDTEMAVVESGVSEVIRDAKVRFADLNYEESAPRPNRLRCSSLKELHFPSSVLEADLIVSMPKLKTHHWAGITASMKNLYGVLPGCVYGWPKNVLHYVGIPESVVDIYATAPKTVSIIDAIVCMEGDGPIMGTPKSLGVLAVGLNPTAVDATCCRLMGVEPTRIRYLQLAGGSLGPVAEVDILQRGEPWRGLVQPFTMLDAPHLHGLQGSLRL